MSERDLLRTQEYGDLILHNHWRLEGLQVVDTTGENNRGRGWNTHDGIEVSETIDSSKTPFEPLILLVPPHLVGTHEATDPDYIPQGDEDKKGFTGITFENGWDGSPIAVAAQAEVYMSIYEALSANGGKGILENLKFGDLGVLDGHHRRRMAEEGDIKLKYIPVQIIPYLYHDSVVLDTWHSDGKVWTPEQVFECFRIPDKYADAKRTKFGVVGSDGVTRRILDTQPTVKIPLANLV